MPQMVEPTIKYTTVVSGFLCAGLTWMTDVEIYQITFDIHSVLGGCFSYLTNFITIVTLLCCLDKAKEKTMSFTYMSLNS